MPVSLRDYLTLMEALEKDLAERRVEDFYHLARGALSDRGRHGNALRLRRRRASSLRVVARREGSNPPSYKAKAAWFPNAAFMVAGACNQRYLPLWKGAA